MHVDLSHTKWNYISLSYPTRKNFKLKMFYEPIIGRYNVMNEFDFKCYLYYISSQVSCLYVNVYVCVEL